MSPWIWGSIAYAFPSHRRDSYGNSKIHLDRNVRGPFRMQVREEHYNVVSCRRRGFYKFSATHWRGAGHSTEMDGSNSSQFELS